jgi:hypothetical protein
MRLAPQGTAATPADSEDAVSGASSGKKRRISKNMETLETCEGWNFGFNQQMQVGLVLSKRFSLELS